MPHKYLFKCLNKKSIFTKNIWTGQQPLIEIDPDMYNLIHMEKLRQCKSLDLIASENFTSRASLEAMGSCLNNKYSEGYPSQRYYAGNEYIDQIERITQTRALNLFGLDPNKWGVNVQPYSGSSANMAVYTGLLNPHDRIMGLDLAHGGHLTHGFMTATRKVSATSIFFESMPYQLDIKTGLIDYDALERNSLLFRPKIIIAGASAYSKLIDYERMKKICDQVGATLFSDMAHISGLVAAKVIPSPFEHSDVVSTTTHKTLRSVRAGLIFFRKGVKSISEATEKVYYDYEKKINSSVFPGLQGGPHNHSIAGIGVSLKEALSDDFKLYQKQILLNCKAMCKRLIELNYEIVSGGSDNHLCLVNLKPKNIDGNEAENLLQAVSIIVNKNTIPGDNSAIRPTGVRLGTPALTSRNFREKDFETTINLFNRGIEIAQHVKKTKSFLPLHTQLILMIEPVNTKEYLISSQQDVYTHQSVIKLKNEVEEFANSFQMPGYEHI